MRIKLAIALLSLTVPVMGVAQSNDAAEQRARIANQRIQAEAARQAEEEEKRQEELERVEAEQARVRAEQERLASRQATAEAQQEKERLARLEPAVVESAPRAPAVTPVPPTRAEMNKALEQLRTLGELRDAGYVTEDEFERIKKKIIDATD